MTSRLAPSPSLSVADASEVRRYTGTLSAEAVQAAGITETTVVLLLSSEETLTCEDLGQQVRRFIRRRGSAMESNLDVWISANDDAAVVASFLTRERIKAAQIRPVSVDDLSGATHVQTPTLLIIEPDGSFVGAGNVGRAANVRSASFVDSLEHWNPPE